MQLRQRARDVGRAEAVAASAEGYFSSPGVREHGCNLYQSGDVWGLSTTGAGIAFQMNFAIGVPPDPLIIGQHFYFQAFSVAPGANALEVLATNGIDFLIGNQ